MLKMNTEVNLQYFPTHTNNEMMPLIMRATMNQFERTHFLNDSIDSSDNKSRRSVARGPAGSTSRQYLKTSQYLPKAKVFSIN